jgi:predicted metal-binding protein
MAKASGRGFKAACIKCGEMEVSVSLGDVTVFTCGSCSEEFTEAQVKAMIEEWQAVLAWTAIAPTL